MVFLSIQSQTLHCDHSYKGAYKYVYRVALNVFPFHTAWTERCRFNTQIEMHAPAYGFYRRPLKVNHTRTLTSMRAQARAWMVCALNEHKRAREFWGGLFGLPAIQKKQYCNSSFRLSILHTVYKSVNLRRVKSTRSVRVFCVLVVCTCAIIVGALCEQWVWAVHCTVGTKFIDWVYLGLPAGRQKTWWQTV